MEELVEFLIKCKFEESRGGEIAWVYANTKVSGLNKFPYNPDGSTKTPKERNAHPEDALQGEWTNRFKVEIHFSEDYAKTMAKALGIKSYTPKDDPNREHLINGVLMRYRSTMNPCIVAMPDSRVSEGLFRDGVLATEEDKAYLKPYRQKKPEHLVPYLTIGVKNITRISIGNRIVEVHITDTTYNPSESESEVVEPAETMA